MKKCGHLYYAYCQKCNSLKLKRDMHYILTNNYNPKILCFLCDDCFSRFLEEYEMSM